MSDIRGLSNQANALLVISNTLYGYGFQPETIDLERRGTDSAKRALYMLLIEGEEALPEPKRIEEVLLVELGLRIGKEALVRKNRAEEDIFEPPKAAVEEMQGEEIIRSVLAKLHPRDPSPVVQSVQQPPSFVRKSVKRNRFLRHG